MRKALVISTPLFCIAGVLLEILSSDSFGKISLGNTVLTFTAILSIIAILFTVAVLSVTRKQIGSSMIPSKTSGVLLFVASLALGFDAFQGFLTALTSENHSGLFPILITVFEFISAIIIVIFACKIFLNFELKYEKSLLLSLIPTIWLLVKLAYEFLGYTRVADISAHYYHVLMTSSTLMYLLYYFKSASGGFITSVAPVVSLTLPISLFSTVTVIPSVARAINESTSVLDVISGFDVYCLILAVFAYTTSLKLVFLNRNIEEE